MLQSSWSVGYFVGRYGAFGLPKLQPAFEGSAMTVVWAAECPAEAFGSAILVADWFSSLSLPSCWWREARRPQRRSPGHHPQPPGLVLGPQTLQCEVHGKGSEVEQLEEACGERQV